MESGKVHEFMNQWHHDQSHLTKMGTHSFRATEKEAAQHNPLQIHGFTCKVVVHNQLHQCQLSFFWKDSPSFRCFVLLYTSFDL